MAPALFLIHLAPLHRFYLLPLFSAPFCTAVLRHTPVAVRYYSISELAPCWKKERQTDACLLSSCLSAKATANIPVNILGYIKIPKMRLSFSKYSAESVIIIQIYAKNTSCYCFFINNKSKHFILGMIIVAKRREVRS